MVKKNEISMLIEGKCEDAKARIIRAALEEFAVRSLAAARTRQIAARAGVNHAAINYYFGGKKELYIEVIRQIAEFDNQYFSQFYKRGNELLKQRNPSPEEARDILEDFVVGRLWPEDSSINSLARSAVLVVTREEMYQTDAFQILYDNCFERNHKFMEKMLSIAAKGKIAGEDLRIAAEMLFSSIILFNSNRAAFNRINNWEKFGDAEVKKVRKMFKKLICKLLD